MKKTFILLSMMAGSFLANTAFGQVVFQGLNPVPAQGFYNFATADWGDDLNIPANAVTGFGVVVDDGTAGDSLGCGTLVNAGAVSGKIAFVYRGDCEFGTKAFNAQTAGAIAVVVINNVSGTMAMGAGAQGGSVTIPVVMIGQETGAMLRPYLDAGTLEIFLGSKLNLFPNDLGLKKGDVVRPQNYATPSLLAQDTSEFKVLLGANVRNFGNLAQTNAELSATIMLNGTTEVYSESISVPSIGPNGDSAYIALPTFYLPNGNVAKYTLTYTVSSDSAGDDPNDDVITQDFYITDGAYSKSRYDVAADKPIRTSGYTSADGPNIKWGILMNAVKGSRVKATGIQFSASTAATDSLTGQIVTGYLYEWEDANEDGGIADDELNEVAVGFYSYTSNLQNEFITIPLSDFPNDGPALEDDKVYYAAVEYEGTVTVFFGTDENLDYEQTINAFSQSINPLYNGSTSTWYGGGFGSDLTVSIALLTAVNDASIEENAPAVSLSVYPNPASDVVNVVFSNDVANGDAQLQLVDVAGRTVLNNQYNITKTQHTVSLNTTSLANGTYFLRVNLNGQAVKSLPIVVSK